LRQSQDSKYAFKPKNIGTKTGQKACVLGLDACHLYVLENSQRSGGNETRKPQCFLKLSCLNS